MFAMPLLILNVAALPEDMTLLRYFHQTLSAWTGHLADGESLGFGVAWTNPQLCDVEQANRMLGVALPKGMTSEQAVQQAQRHFADRGCICRQWVMDPSSPPDAISPMVENLIALGFSRSSNDIMHLDRVPAGLVAETNIAVTIIPTRASFRHARQFFAEAAENQDQATEAALLHLDDPHYDALIALSGQSAVAHAGVLTVGQLGLIEQVVVGQQWRRQGIGALMVDRVLEICVRSQLRHIFMSIPSQDSALQRLCAKFGFRKIGRLISLRQPQAAISPC